MCQNLWDVSYYNACFCYFVKIGDRQQLMEIIVSKNKEIDVLRRISKVITIKINN